MRINIQRVMRASRCIVVNKHVLVVRPLQLPHMTPLQTARTITYHPLLVLYSPHFGFDRHVIGLFLQQV